MKIASIRHGRRYEPNNKLGATKLTLTLWISVGGPEFKVEASSNFPYYVLQTDPRVKEQLRMFTRRQLFANARRELERMQRS